MYFFFDFRHDSAGGRINFRVIDIKNSFFSVHLILDGISKHLLREPSNCPIGENGNFIPKENVEKNIYWVKFLMKIEIT